ncbi:hypothetical protein LWI29_030127 [Acer saccharum]|uniref:Uncharacterized protein n=1 Tax=Acer saccharum TaxID=4024 RepID=A0AA39RRV7_ACESA|nr:hypothetical protein LWI29_030127 [Acer saccharum]KAK1575312.1 hypothetical protein Q3G72_004420 [Acer saccharum]
MLLAVEGGGFFSSSASGYSKGLTLLLLGQRNEDNKPMRVSPWNQYQLVDQEPDPDLQLASAAKNRLSRGCASFVCFGRASAGPDTPSPLKVGPAQQQDVSPGPLSSDKGKDHTFDIEDDNGNLIKVSLKSSLKKPSHSIPVPVQNVNEHETVDEEGNEIPGHTDTDRRKVQWTDACGSELVEVREFEPSETGGSDDEFDNGIERSCSCTIM